MENEAVIQELEKIGRDLMDAIGEKYPPAYFPSCAEMLQEIEETGAPYGDDAMFSVCAINSARITELVEKLKG